MNEKAKQGLMEKYALFYLLATIMVMLMAVIWHDKGDE